MSLLQPLGLLGLLALPVIVVLHLLHDRNRYAVVPSLAPSGPATGAAVWRAQRRLDAAPATAGNQPPVSEARCF